MLKKALLLCFSLSLISCGSGLPYKLKAPKKEFRGFWIATVVNIDWPTAAQDPIDKKKADFLKLLDFYQQLNFNAAIVQLRTAGDAFYPSELAPWSRFLTGKEGEASVKYQDLLPWMIKETHKRGMEFHAWMNPYRATFDLNTEVLSENHDYYKHPEWMIKYGRKYYYNPGLPEVQKHLTKIISQVVEKYDVDAIHFDDYFYPYTIKDEVFNDTETYRQYAKEGFSVADWRRENINALVKNTFQSIKSKKPWVQFGISPFGVWRNIASDSLGSDTRAGQTTYDDLYADALTWIKNGWIDYIAPQLYWSMHYPPASHTKLIKWWAQNTKQTQLYIGNGPYKIRNNTDKAWKKKKELPNQLKLARRTDEVDGNIFFSAKSLFTKNTDVVEYLRQKYYKYPAIPTLAKKYRDNQNVPDVNSVIIKNDQYVFKLALLPEDTRQLIFYGFKSEKKIDFNAGKNILKVCTVAQGNSILIPKKIMKRKKIFAISYLDRFRKESKPFLFTFNASKDGVITIKTILAND